MILGTSKIWLKSGPVDLPIITNIFQKIQEKYGIIFKKYYFSYLRIRKLHFSIFLKGIPTMCRTKYVLAVLQNYFLKQYFDYIFLKILFVERRIDKWLFSINKIEKSLDVSFISIKKHETLCCIFLFSGKKSLNFFISRKAP